MVRVGGTSFAALILVASFLAAACTETRELPKAEIALGDGRLIVEVAADDKAKRVGLMHRNALAEDAGMLFVFDGRSPACLWMKNTKIALGVAFIDEGGVVVNVAEMEPDSEVHHCSTAPVKYALEVNRGWLQKQRVAPGARLVIAPGSR